MQVDKIKLKDNYVIVFKEADEVETSSGLILSENTDDFLIHSKVVNSSSELYPVDKDVVFHVVDALSFREADKVYYILEEKANEDSDKRSGGRHRNHAFGECGNCSATWQTSRGTEGASSGRATGASARNTAPWTRPKLPGSPC